MRGPWPTGAPISKTKPGTCAGVALQAWRSPKDVTGFALAITGAGWSVATASPIFAALAALGAGLSMLPSRADGGAYSYLFEAGKRLK